MTRSIVATLTGFRFYNDRTARFAWGEVSFSGWGLGIEIDNYGPDGNWLVSIKLLCLSLYLNIPFLPDREVKIGEISESWGVKWLWGREWGRGDLHCNWGYRCKIIRMPWAWEWVRSSYLMPDGATWLSERRQMKRSRKALVPNPEGGGRLPYFFHRDMPEWKAVYPYRYVLRSGEVQNVDATIRMTEMEWRWRALTWLAWPRMVRRSIDVEFSAEVGEGAGSWKGGVLGCGWDLLPDEMPREALMRMQETKKFGR